jgi:hypothetical protein
MKIQQIVKFKCPHCHREHETKLEATDCAIGCKAGIDEHEKEEAEHRERVEFSRRCEHSWIYTKWTTTEPREVGYSPIEYTIGIERQCKRCFLQQRRFLSFADLKDAWYRMTSEVQNSEMYIRWGYLSTDAQKVIDEELNQ